MAIELETYRRKSFEVKAVRVTKKNMWKVATWCNGRVRKQADNKRYIKVDAIRPLTEKQTKAFIGDWVLEAKNGFKVYSNVAFMESFEPLSQFEILINQSIITPMPTAEEVIAELDKARGYYRRNIV